MSISIDSFMGRNAWQVATLIPLLIAPAMTFVHLPERETVAFLLIFGVPDQVVESLVGREGKVADVISVNLGDGWVSGREFLESLVGKRVTHGNVYTIRSGNPLYNPSNPLRHPDILIEESARLPLKVVGTQEDLQLVFNRDGAPFRTFFGLDQLAQGGYVNLSFEGRTGAVTRYGFIGNYVLENGVMVSNGDGGWYPAPVSQNAMLRIFSSDYSILMVLVYSFPFDGFGYS